MYMRFRVDFFLELTDILYCIRTRQCAYISRRIVTLLSRRVVAPSRLPFRDFNVKVAKRFAKKLCQYMIRERSFFSARENSCARA